MVRGNFFGTDVTGTAGFTTNTSGIIDKGTGNTIGGGNGTTPGGACTGDCNLITSNSPYGINVDMAATGTIIQGNFIGTDVTGTQPFGIQSVGILIEGASVQVGGKIPQVRNIVSGNPIGGIAPSGPGAVIEGNYIGTDPTGAAAVPGSGNGISMDKATATMIGGTAPGAGNLISGAAGNSSGILILESSNTQIMGNLIGTAADGVSPLPNQLDGVFIGDNSSNNTIGGTIAGAGNVIAYNSQDGVEVDGQMPTVVGNTIRGNSIYLNDNLGIQLGHDGNTQLDPPTIDGVGPLHGTACAPCTVEVFTDDFDQGRVFEGSVFTNDGNWSLVVKLVGPNVTATNTDMNGNTSEFSEPFILTTPTPTPTATTATMTATPTRSAPITSSQTATATVTPPANATPTATGAACTGDCGGTGSVSISDLITGVNIALGNLPVSACPAFENADGQVDIAQLIRGVDKALNGCPS
jgi:hypothetical protein